MSNQKTEQTAKVNAAAVQRRRAALLEQLRREVRAVKAYIKGGPPRRPR
jgi:hypothetical protein